MAVMNRIPQTLASMDIQGDAKSAAAAWAIDNSDFLAKVLEQHELFITESEIEKYQAAYDGYLETIDTRDKSRGDDINHKLQVDLAQLVIDTVVDYMTGKPISWTVDETDLPEEDKGMKSVVEEYRKAILQLLKEQNAQRVLAEQLRMGSIGGYSPIIAWVDEEGEIDYDEFAIQEVIPVYDTRGKLRLVVRRLVIDNGEGQETTKLEVYDQKYITYLLANESGQGFELDPDEEETGNPVKHHAGRIPASFFTNGTPAKYEDRKKRVGTSDLAIVFSLLENLAGVMSDKANTVDRLLDQFLLFKNVTTTEDEVVKMRKARAIVLKSKESDASFLAPGQEDGAVENHLDRVENKLLQTSNTPKINELSGATATEIKMKYAGMDIKAGKKELYFSQAIKDFIAILTDLLNAKRILEGRTPEEAQAIDVYAILRDPETNKPPSGIALYKAEWLDFTINRNLPQNFMEIAQIVSTLKDTVPDSYLYELLWFISDPVAALKEMEKQKDAGAKRTAQAGLNAMGFGGEFGQTGTEGGTDNSNDPAAGEEGEA